MKNSQLIAVLKTLTKKEIRELRKWLQSPVHNQREDVIKLFNYLTSNGHLEDEKYIKKDRIFKKIFPNETFDDAKIRQTAHFLLKTIEEYFIFEEVKSNEIKSKISLLTIYRKRKLKKLFNKTIKNLQNLQEKNLHQDQSYLWNEYLIQFEKYTFQEGIKSRTTDFNLQEVSDTLDLSYISNKIRLSCLMLSHQAVYKTIYDTGLLEDVLTFTKKKNLEEIPAVAIYYHIYFTLTEKDNPTHFDNLKIQIENNGHLFPKTELRDIYLMAINYSISRMNIGESRYVRETFNLFRKGIENDVFIENGLINRFTFRNIINSGTIVKEFRWVKQFIDNYQQYLNPTFRENLVKFGMAKLYFTEGDYQSAMRLLIQFEDEDFLTNLYGKSMLIRMYFEEGEYDSLESLLESMRNYIHRKKVIGYHKTIYSNLTKYTRKLIRVSPYDKAQIDKLRDEIISVNPLPEKQWLLQQLDNL